MAQAGATFTTLGTRPKINKMKQQHFCHYRIIHNFECVVVEIRQLVGWLFLLYLNNSLYCERDFYEIAYTGLPFLRMQFSSTNGQENPYELKQPLAFCDMESMFCSLSFTSTFFKCHRPQKCLQRDHSFKELT